MKATITLYPERKYLEKTFGNKMSGNYKRKVIEMIIIQNRSKTGAYVLITSNEKMQTILLALAFDSINSSLRMNP